MMMLLLFSKISMKGCRMVAGRDSLFFTEKALSCSMKSFGAWIRYLLRSFTAKIEHSTFMGSSWFRK